MHAGTVQEYSGQGCEPCSGSAPLTQSKKGGRGSKAGQLSQLPAAVDDDDDDDDERIETLDSLE
jgi:hypothetical protein